MQHASSSARSSIMVGLASPRPGFAAERRRDLRLPSVPMPAVSPGGDAVTIPIDTVGAFVGDPSELVAGVPGGPLDGVRLAVKDMFDVVGTVTGAGNPTFAADRQLAAASAPAVQRL